MPLSDFASQGVDLSELRRLELRFGGEGMPQTGSIQLADVRFQEATDPAPLPDAKALIDATPRKQPSAALPDAVRVTANAACAPRVLVARVRRGAMRAEPPPGSAARSAACRLRWSSVAGGSSRRPAR